MKAKWWMLTLASSLFIAATSFADQHSNGCCDPCDCCCDWTFHGDYLYWNVRGCQLAYAVPSDASSRITGDVGAIKPEHEHGFRIGAHKTCNNLCFDLHYTYYRNDASDQFTNTSNEVVALLRSDDFTVITNGNIALTLADWDFDLDIVSARICYRYDLNNCFTIAAFSTSTALRLDHKFTVTYGNDSPITGLADRVTLTSDSRALGGGFGVEGRYRILQCLDFHVSSGLDLLLAHIDKDYRYDTTTNGFTTFTANANIVDECWKGLTYLHSEIGLEFAYTCGDCIAIFVSAGYEIQHLLNADGFNLIFAEANGADTVLDRYQQNIGLEGLVARAGFTF